MKLKHHFILTICAAGLVAPRVIHAQSVLVLSNTNEPFGGTTKESDGARIPFVTGVNAGGYELTGVAIEFGANANKNFTNIEIRLYGANTPYNLDNYLSVITAPTPTSAGLYFYSWPTNIFLPGQTYDHATNYYNLDVLLGAEDFTRGNDDELNVAYTTSTNCIENAGWGFLPDYTSIDGYPGVSLIFSLFATILPPPPPPVLYPIYLTNAVTLADGSFLFGFTNSPGLSFTAYATTNMALPLTNWFYVGNPENVSCNYYEYNSGPGTVTDPDFARVFIRVTSSDFVRCFGYFWFTASVSRV